MLILISDTKRSCPLFPLSFKFSPTHITRYLCLVLKHAGTITRKTLLTMKQTLTILFAFILMMNVNAQHHAQQTKSNWQSFTPEERISVNDFLLRKKQQLSTTSNHQLELKKSTQTGDLKHHKIQQYINNVPIEGAISFLHEKEGKINAHNGLVVENISINTTPQLSENTTLQIALNSIGAAQYAWQSTSYESILKSLKNDATASYYPVGELLVFSPSAFKENDDFRLAYKFSILSLTPFQKLAVYVDAHAGTVIRKMDELHHANTTCVGQTSYNGNQTFDCLYDANLQRYQLLDTNRNILTMEYGLTQLADVTNGSTYWSANPAAIDAHWATANWYDYFSNEFGWNSFDGNGGELLNVVNFGNNWENAAWNGSFASYGKNANGNPYTALDIVCHEVTHGFIDATANFSYFGESGALSESFADIFSLAIEHEVLGAQADWVFGADVTNTADGIRRLDFPTIDHYSNLYTGNSDHGGVHLNSGIQNRWFYLVASEIGIKKAAKICFHAVRDYLTPYSQLIDSRNATVQAVISLFPSQGGPSPEILAVCNAWVTVGVSTNCNLIESITLLTPNGGESLTEGQTTPINWQSSNTANNYPNVTLEYSVDGGDTWATIINKTPNDGSYDWVVPSLSSNQCLVRCSNSANIGIVDVSNGVFSIGLCDVQASFTGDVNGCTGEWISLTNTSQNATNYQWYTNDFPLHNNTDFLLKYGGRNVALEVTLEASNSACTSTFTQGVFISDTVFFSDFTYSKNGLDLQFSATNIDPFSTYIWDFGNTTIASGKDFGLTYSASDIYEVCLTVTSPCATETTCKNIVVNNQNGPINNCNNEWLALENDLQILTPFMVETTNGEVWAAGSDEFSVYNGTSWQSIAPPVSGLFVNCMIAGDNNEVWVGSNLGLHHYHNNAWSVIYDSNNTILPENEITSLHKSTDGTLFIGTLTNSLTTFKNNVWNTIPLPVNEARAILETSNGDLWVGAYAEVAQNTVTGWTVFDKANANISDTSECRKIVETDDGKIWFSFSGFDGLTLYNQGGWIHYFEQNSDLPSNLITDLATDDKGQLWLATFNGLAFVDYTFAWEGFTTVNSPIHSNALEAILGRTNGEIWMTTQFADTIDVYKRDNFLGFSYPPIICSGNNTLLQNTSPLGGIFEWEIYNKNSPDQVELFSGFNQNYTFNKPGSYQVTLYQSASGCEQAYSQSINIFPSAADLELPTDIGLCGTGTVVATNYSNFAAYEWKNAANVVLDSLETIYLTQAGVYSLKVTDFCGATATKSFDLVLDNNCVWPGDTNADGVVNNFDLLNIGLAYDNIGIIRNGASGNWLGQAATIWQGNFENGVNYKHADTDGNGIIDQDDKQLIFTNYKKEHGNPTLNKLPNTPSSLILKPYIKNTTSLPNGEGAAIELGVSLTNSTGNPIAFYGLAFDMTYETPSLIHEKQYPLGIDQLLTANQDALSIVYQNGQTTELAFVGTNHENIILDNQTAALEGGREIFGIIVEHDVLDGGDPGNYFKIQLDNILMIQADGDTIAVAGDTAYYLVNEAFYVQAEIQHITCQQTGSIELTVSDTTSLYTYAWNDGASSSNRYNIPAGNYSVTVSDFNGNQVTADSLIVLEEANPLEVNMVVYGQDLYANVTGGSGNYVYQWNTGETTNPIYATPNTSYEVTVFEDAGCTITDSINVICQTTVDSLFTTTCGWSGAGTFVDVHQTTGGCDSLVVTFVAPSKPIYSNISVLLEGAYRPSGGPMRTNLYNLQLLPGQQNNPHPAPFTAEHWNYEPLQEELFAQFDYDQIVQTWGFMPVDWVLVSYRTEKERSTTITQHLGLVLEYGQVVFPQDCVWPLQSPDSVYVVVEHRNHVGVMTPEKIPVVSDSLSYDFRMGDSYSAGAGTGQKMFFSGYLWGLIAANPVQAATTSYEINGLDKIYWSQNNGSSIIYHPADFNLSGEVSGVDRILWERNNGQFSSVPR